MPPKQNQPSPQPNRSFEPHPPHFDYGSNAGYSQHFQQHPSGHYEVVPPPQSGQNAGHTGHNPYDFIMNPNMPNQGRAGFNLAGGSFFTRIALLAGGTIVIIIVAAIVISALTPKGDTPGLISIAERQQEIIRVSTAATQKATSQDTKNFVANVQASIASSQNQVTAYLTAHGKKLGSKQLALDQSSQTDTDLANAASANNYDGAVTQNLTSQLQTYEGLLQTTFNQTNSTKAHNLLQTNYNSAQLLLTQAKALSAELGQ